MSLYSAIAALMISGSEFHSSKVFRATISGQYQESRTKRSNIRFKPRNLRKSFNEHTFHSLACFMKIISMTRIHGCVPRAPHALTGDSVASWRIRARSSSLNQPSRPRLSLEYLVSRWRQNITDEDIPSMKSFLGVRVGLLFVGPHGFLEIFGRYLDQWVGSWWEGSGWWND